MSRKWIWRAGGCLGWAVTLWVWGWFWLTTLSPRDREPQHLQECRRRLHHVAWAAVAFRDREGRLPRDVAELRPLASDAQDLACPRGGAYALQDPGPAGNAPVARCDRHYLVHLAWGRARGRRPVELTAWQDGRVTMTRK